MDGVLPDLTCSICLELLNDPHQFPCGHSYCFSCINSMRNHNNYSCPECRREFTNGGDIVRNYRLASIANTFREHKPKAGDSVVKGSERSSTGVSWPQLLFILTTVTVLLKVYTLWGTAEEEDGTTIKIHPDKQPNQGGFSLVAVAWSLVYLLSLLLQVLWLPLWGIWLSVSLLLSLVVWCVEFIMSCILLVIDVFFKAIYATVNIVLYACGTFYILNLVANIR
ncbi:uncharacterized protein LOC105028535 isoform X2 [Esox lucius]|uniref:uncharacterized protein LOC105028535 isoform X2 n=1 Tax=Esox lucius TaxID=8010 RepID=UPI001476DFC3|nr:uncharacterized protein LOC105028535 isoform X2 [Esox lucius]